MIVAIDGQNVHNQEKRHVEPLDLRGPVPENRAAGPLFTTVPAFGIVVVAVEHEFSLCQIQFVFY